jgi:hypothetical protein
MGDVALHNHHVLHLMLALTALHLGNCRPSRKEEYTATANVHYEKALSDVTSELSSINTDNCDALLLSVQLICFVTWARGPQPGEFLAFGEHGKSEWLAMFKGVRTMLNSFERSHFTKTYAPDIRSRNRPLATVDEPLDHEKQLSDLREHVFFVTLDPLEREDNVRSIDILQECYTNRYGGVDSEYHVVFAWLYRMSDAFTERLQQRDPIALIIYAHFAVLMQEMEKFWYMRGWVPHIMSGIFHAIPTEHIPWIRWPMARVGWIAP